MEKLSKILLPVDFSKDGAGAAAYAGMLARHFGATVTLLHVNPLFVPAVASAREFSGALDVGWVTALEALLRKDLSSYEQTRLRGVTLQRIVATGDPAQLIVQQAHKEGSDLIVMETRGFGPFRRFLLGSVAAKVLDDANCAVWTGAHLEHDASRTAPISQVLCAIDNGPASLYALTWAGGLAQEFHASLTVVHAISKLDPPDDFLIAGGLPRREENAAATVRCFLTKAGIPAEILIAAGEPATVVAKAAEDTGADVVVIGRSLKKGGMGRLHPHAYSIIRESPCPVVSV
jgi:nucleotide-binding universal stress UspA family protein